MANPRFNTQVSQPRGQVGRVKKAMGGMSNARKDMMSGYYKDDMGMQGGAMYKKGGSVKKKKKKQGYKDRKDESIAMRIRKKRTKKQLKASRDDSFGKFGSKAKKSGKINKQENFMVKPISKKKNPGLVKLAKKKPELAKKFGYNPKRIVAKKGGKVR